ncbi:uncharacterized protein LOC106179421 [Lingula anatina]|uniref:Uncharacterized protein LOC106179421 n=1 Tax=Lingula anatina TaxID=7574 RepID=A0A1S3K7S5_LINAN|nr:uncharacterized protein LOC106179421 [Lingula anatina]|eukprot:XP_013418494.1 uncharacterized protein LOC106179421 [Lingula anatina]
MDEEDHYNFDDEAEKILQKPLTEAQIKCKSRCMLATGETVPLVKCEDDQCGCGQYHCPFCPTRQFKPTTPTKVRSHLMCHIKAAVKYEGKFIIRCHTEGCNPPEERLGHYHCPVETCPYSFDRSRTVMTHLKKFHDIIVAPDGTTKMLDPRRGVVWRIKQKLLWKNNLAAKERASKEAGGAPPRGSTPPPNAILDDLALKCFHGKLEEELEEVDAGDYNPKAREDMYRRAATGDPTKDYDVYVLPEHIKIPAGGITESRKNTEDGSTDQDGIKKEQEDISNLDGSQDESQVASNSSGSGMTPIQLWCKSVSIVGPEDKFPVRRCKSPGCNCGLYHCPLCPITLYIPGTKSNLHYHYKQHGIYGYAYGDTMILKSHIELCTPNGQSMKGHVHCPVDGCTVVSQYRRTMETHLRRVHQSGFQVGNTASGTQQDEVVQPSPCLSGNAFKIRASKVEKLCDQKPVLVKDVNQLLSMMKKCRDKECGCYAYHCPLCATSQFKPNKYAKVKSHVLVHMKTAVKYRKKYLVKVYQPGCKGQSIDHYHCPVCSKAICKKQKLLEHLYNHILEGKPRPAQVFSTVAAVVSPELLDFIPGDKEIYLQEVAERTRVNLYYNNDWCVMQGSLEAVRGCQDLLAKFTQDGDSDLEEETGYQDTEMSVDGNENLDDADEGEGEGEEEEDDDDDAMSESLTSFPSSVNTTPSKPPQGGSVTISKTTHPVVTSLLALQDSPASSSKTNQSSVNCSPRRSGRVSHVQGKYRSLLSEPTHTESPDKVDHTYQTVSKTDISPERTEKNKAQKAVEEVERSSEATHDMEDSSMGHLEEDLSQLERAVASGALIESQATVSEVLSKANPILSIESQSNGEVTLSLRLPPVEHVKHEVKKKSKNSKPWVKERHKAGGHYECPTCGRVFAMPHYLTRHLNRKICGEEGKDNAKFGPWTRCSICGQHAERDHHYKYHAEMTVTCAECGESMTPLMYQDHLMETGHNGYNRYLAPGSGPRGKMVCSLCGNVYNKASMNDHIKHIHMGVRDHTCNLCGKSFQNKSVLKNHVETHKEAEARDRPHKCPHCPAAFFKPMVLAEHINRHTGDRPFKCDLCDKTFAYRTVLQKHRFTHGQAGSHQCDVCHRRYRSKHHLRKHRVMHDGNRYRCPCGKVYTRKMTYWKHGKTCPMYMKKPLTTPTPTSSASVDVIEESVPPETEASTASILIEEVAVMEEAQKQEGISEFMCGHCYEIFRTLDEAQVHIATHAQPGQEVEFESVDQVVTS